MSTHDIQLIAPETAESLADAQAILREYVQGLAVDLSFQGVEAEVCGLPGPYAPPGGLLLLAYLEGTVAACGAFCALPDADYPNACEMRRLYVRPAFRRFGLGRLLAQALLDGARRAGYSTMLLDTLDDMEAARGLYASLGFEGIPPYYYSPIAGAHYFKAELI
jgi:putative acetyltransferase